MEKFKFIKGLPIPQASAEISLLGFEMRVSIEDGNGITHTMEYLGTRVNVETSKGIVIKILSIG